MNKFNNQLVKCTFSTQYNKTLKMWKFLSNHGRLSIVYNMEFNV